MPRSGSCALLAFKAKQSSSYLKVMVGASLVAQWLRLRLPMQGTRVRALAREDPTCRGEARSVHNNYWAWALELMCHSCWARVPQLLKPMRLEPVLRRKRGRCNEKPGHRNEDPTQPKIKKNKNKKNKNDGEKQYWKRAILESGYILSDDSLLNNVIHRPWS